LEGKKRIVGGGGELGEIDQSSITVFSIYFIYVVAIISTEIVRMFLYLYGFFILSWKV